MSCFMGVIYGIYSVGLSAPTLKLIKEGQIAGKFAYDIIDRTPKIALDEGERDFNLQGRIEFRNVSFSYPSKPNEKILDNFTMTFERG